jgi:hypothetical protein
MNNTVEFKIRANLIDCYLYAGYLFLIMSNGRITYVSYRRVIHRLKERYPQFAGLIDLIFLHNEYSKSLAGKILLGIQEIKNETKKLWFRASKEIDFSLDFAEIEPYCEEVGEWQSMPLDIRMYAMRLFLGTKEGLFESCLNMDEKGYKLHPTTIDKVFDAKVINLNAKNGSLVISADKDGLFGAEIFEGSQRTGVDEKAITSKRSLRTAWASVCDLMNYESSKSFEYIRNQSSIIVKQPKKEFRYGDNVEKKRIVSFGESIYDMDSLLRVVDFNKDDIEYCFDSTTTGFFILKDGSFVNVKFRNESGFAEVYFSSSTYSIQQKLYKKKQSKKVLSSCLIPDGCVVEYFDRVVLYQKGKAYTLAEKQVNNVRSYIGSRNYRDIVSIISNEEVAFHSVDSFDLIESVPAFGKLCVPVAEMIEE